MIIVVFPRLMITLYILNRYYVPIPLFVTECNTSLSFWALIAVLMNWISLPSSLYSALSSSSFLPLFPTFACLWRGPVSSLWAGFRPGVRPQFSIMDGISDILWLNLMQLLVCSKTTKVQALEKGCLLTEFRNVPVTSNAPYTCGWLMLGSCHVRQSVSTWWHFLQLF